MPPGLDVSNGLVHSIRASRPEKGKDGKDGKEGKEGKAFAITMKGKKGPPQRALGKGQESYSTQKGTWERGQEKGRKQSKDKGGRRPKGGDELGLSRGLAPDPRPRVNMEGAIGSRTVAPPATAPVAKAAGGAARVVGLPIGAKPQDYARSAPGKGSRPGDSSQDGAAWRPTVNKIRKERVSQDATEND